MCINLTSQRSELVCPRWVRFHNLSCTKEVPLPSPYVVLESPLCAQTPPPVRRVVDGVWGCFWKEENEGEYSPWMHQTEKKTLFHCFQKAARWLQSSLGSLVIHHQAPSEGQLKSRKAGGCPMAEALLWLLLCLQLLWSVQGWCGPCCLLHVGTVLGPIFDPCIPKGGH